MRSIIIAALTITLSACAGAPQLPQIHGGQKVTLPGVSFVAPAHKSWSLLVHTTYQVALRAKEDNPNETWVVAAMTHQIPTFSSPQDFLTHVKSERAADPQTGQFEITKNNAQLYTERLETCVKHEAESKDFGAKRGGDYSIIQYFGMNCIHPKSPTVGILVELSRKAPPDIEYLQFKTLGSQLLNSVEFSAYR